MEVAVSEEAEGYREVIRYMEDKMKAARTREEAWDSSEEEEDYDYGQECEEVFCRRER